MSVDALVPVEVAKKAEDAGVIKGNTGAMKLFVLGVLAGSFIALGAVFATTITAGGELGFGLSRLLGGLVFSLGLILVVIAGAELFTGNNLIVMALASGRITLRQLLRNWGIVYVGNFAGALGVAVLMLLSEQYLQGGGAIGRRMLAIGSAKTQIEFVPALALGILCNILVCLAVWLCMSARTATDKVLVILFPITAFVAAGFEHCVANMYFVPKALLVKAFASESFWSEIGASSADYSELTWASFFGSNLLPVTIGNIIGGALFVGLVYWFIYLRNVKS
ncbi:MAG: formate transporter FocA [Myxococcales bacterium]|nr:formate transporter FocA [Myxococcales bacterium]